MSFSAWKNVIWPQVESRVLRYQTRIFKASREGNLPKVRCLQKRLLSSLDAKLLAVRQVTTLNKGKRTAGIDAKLYLKDKDKEKLVNELRLDGKSSLIRRVYIEKPGKTEKRPLGIPTMKDRAKQALCRIVLDPEWEARFEENSYGFRKGRSCHDAMEAIFLSLRNSNQEKEYRKYILDADISKCFDQIDHQYLLQKLNTLPEIETQVQSWLQAGILEEWNQKEKEFSVEHNIIGTPQGGVISPLLANIALHGMELHLKEWITTKPSYAKTNQYSKANKRKSISLIRYADDFVVIHQKQEIVEEAKREIQKWLQKGPQLTLNNEKTIIRKSDEGFSFLGFSVITITRKNKPRIKIYPSKKAQDSLLQKVREIIQRNRSISTFNLIQILRPIIIGWANYFRYSECSDVFKRIDHQIFLKLRAWVFRRDTRNGRKKIKEKYFPLGKEYNYGGTKHKDNWILNGKQASNQGYPEEAWLPRLAWVKSEKWVKIQGSKSPYDGDNLYWAKRTIKHGNWTVRQCRLIQNQKGICTWCKQPFLIDSIVEVDHILPRSLGGKDFYSNLQLLHKHCHVEKSKIDGSQSKQKASNINLGQEPDDGKLSRPDLSTGVKVTRPLV